MHIPKIKKAIQERNITQRNKNIASRQERQIYWTQVMYDKKLPQNIRLQASKLLGMSEGDFIDRREISGPDNTPIKIATGITTIENLKQAAQLADEIIKNLNG